MTQALSKTKGSTQVSRAVRFLRAAFDVSISLRFAVITILSLTVAMIVATFIESLYDTPTAQYWVYRSWWFHLILAMLGMNILCVALSRIPWRRRHAPFLFAHLGILLVLLGSWITQRYGLDGSLRVEEGTASSAVEFQDSVLVLSEGHDIRSVPIRWTPPHASFEPVVLPDLKLKVDQFLAHAEADVRFVPVAESARTYPAARIRIEGGAMRISQEFWLWAGDPSWASIQAGPARLRILTAGSPSFAELAERGSPARGPVFTLTREKDGRISYSAKASDGKVKAGRIDPAKAKGHKIDSGWRGGITITLEEWIPAAVSHATYRPSKILYGMQAPPPAIHVVAGEGREGDSQMWLGLGDRALLSVGGREVAIGFYPQRQTLPFKVKLERFSIEHYDGTRDPREYSSSVRVAEGSTESEPVTISMNEPLVHRGITFYQASYEDAMPRPTVSVFSVNRDPGRWIKYVGSLILVLGAILFMVTRWKRNKESA